MKPIPAARDGKGRWRSIAIVASLAVCLTMSSLVTLDDYAEARFDALFQRALTTFAIARTLNGVISAVQGTEVALQPAGVGLTLTPGEILDPVNDLVERFSWIMLGAAVSLGIQQVLLDVGQWWALRTAVAVVGIGWLLLWWCRQRQPGTRRSAFHIAVFRLLVVLLFLRFAVPLTVVLDESVYELFLADRYAAGVSALESAGATLEKSVADNVPEEPADGGIKGLLGRAWDSARSQLAIEKRLRSIQDRAAEIVSHIVRLSVVFILQTAVLPILFLAVLFQVARQSIRSRR